MISSDIRINGVLIAHLYATNTSGTSDGGLAAYSWVYHDIKTGKRSAGRVEHKRADGAAVLIGKILTAYEGTQRIRARGRRPAEKDSGVRGRVRLRPEGGGGQVHRDPGQGPKVAAAEGGALHLAGCCP